MKRVLFYLVLILVSTSAIAQPIVRRAGDANTVQDGRLSAKYNFLLPQYVDTTSANLNLGVDSCGALIYTYLSNQLWKRSCNPKKWELIGGSAGGSGISAVYPGLYLLATNDSTLRFDTATASGYYIRRKDSTIAGFYPYSSNPRGYISNITGLVDEGTAINLSGNGTSGTPYVISTDTSWASGVSTKADDTRRLDSLRNAIGGGGGGSDPVTTKVIPLSAFRDRENPTIREAEAYIDAVYTGADTLGFYKITPDTIRAVERREIMPGQENYEAFPIITRSPRTQTMIITYQLSRSHAGNSAAAYIRSTDGGRTWSNRLYQANRVTGSDYKAAAMYVDSATGYWYAYYDNGISNTLGRNPRIANIARSTNDAASFDSLTTLDLTSVYAYRTTVCSHTTFKTRAGTILLPTYGLDAVGTNFENWFLRSTDPTFATYTLARPAQDSSTLKLNEATFLEVGDSLLVFMRSEGALGTLYRSYSLDDGVTWSTPAKVTITASATRPNVVKLPDGRLLITQRSASGNQRGVIFISTNNGLTFTIAGNLYPDDEPFMYASQIVIGDNVLSAYSIETGTAAAFANSTAGIWLATFPINNVGHFYKDSVRSTLFKQPGQEFGLMPRYKGFQPLEYVISSDQEKSLYVRSDSTTTQSRTVAMVVGGDILGNTNNSVIRNISHTGIQSSTFSNTPLNQGAVPWSDTIAGIDSITVTGKYITGAVGMDGSIYMAPNLTGGTNLLKLNPQSRDVDYLSIAEASDYRGIASIGDYIYLLATGLSKMKKVNVWTGAVTNVTLTSNGWNGLSYSGGYLWSSKSAATSILKYDPKMDTFAVLTTPSSGGWAAGPFDGRFQWFIGNSTAYWLKVNPTTNEIFEVAKSLPLSGITGARQQGVFDGVELWAGDNTGNIIFRLNPHSLSSRTDTLPSGAYPTVRWDGASMWIVNRTAANLIKYNPKTNTYKAITTPGFGVTNKWNGAVVHQNKVYLVPEDVGKIAVITTNEFGPDPFKRIYDSTKLAFPIDTISVGRMANNRVVIGDSLIIQTSYANAGGSGDRTASVTAATDLSMVGAASTLVNGVTCCITNVYFNIQTVAGKYISFDFGASRFIDEAKFYQSSAVSQGVWQWQGSADNTNWTSIGATFTLGGTGTQTITTLSGNTTAYRYYRLLGVSGSTTNSPYIYEFEFKIASTSERLVYMQTYENTTPGGLLELQRNGGTVEAPTPSSSDSSSKVATTAYVKQNIVDMGKLSVNQTWTGDNIFSGDITASGDLILTYPMTQTTGMNAIVGLDTATGKALKGRVGNGLSVEGTFNYLKLGGTLTENTTISGNSNAYSLTFSNIQSLTVTGNNNHSISGADISLTGTGAINLSGGLSLKRTAATADLTLTSNHYYISVDASAGNVTITLPAATGHTRVYVIKRIDNSGNTVTVQRSGSDTIDAGTSFTLAQYKFKSVISNASNAYEIIGEN